MIEKEKFVQHFFPELDYVKCSYNNLVNIIRAANIEEDELPEDVHDLEDFLKQQIAKNIIRYLLEQAIDYPRDDDGFKTYCAVEKAWLASEDDFAIDCKDFVSFDHTDLYIQLEEFMECIINDFLVPNEFTQLTFIEKSDSDWAYRLSRYFHTVVIVK